MSAASRADRHHAVCGSKPGGADAYYLKEHCAPRATAAGRGAEPSTARGRDNNARTARIATGAVSLYNAYVTEIHELEARIATMQSRFGNRAPPGSEPGYLVTQNCIMSFLASFRPRSDSGSRSPHKSVHARAYAAIKSVAGAPRTPLMEFMIIEGSSRYYDSIVADLARFGIPK